jgi:hypothetical protein
MDHLHLTLRAALAEDRLEEFVRGVELSIGSDFERGLALMLVQRGRKSTCGHQCNHSASA